MNARVAFYARVSSEQQAQSGTIESQISALKERIKLDCYSLLKENQFIDDGFSGSTLFRPGLERLRDNIAEYSIEKLYVHAPDRLARKYAYQYLLIEEFHRYGVDIIFLTNQKGTDPESELLLQVQGIISEYERTKIMERSRRGKLHAATNGSPSVLSGAPYGYRYIAKRDNGAAIFEIIEEEALVVRQLFSWVGLERMSINGATNRLTEMGYRTPTGKQPRWNRGSVHHMLRNPAYKGLAAFGKSKCVPRKLKLRAFKGQASVPKINYSSERMPKEKWIFIPVPAIVDESLFDTVQELLEENKRLKRERKTGARYLLQGLIVCCSCGYGYCGNTATGARKYNYYTCGGNRVYANRERRCNSQSLHADILEELVWGEVKNLLNNPSLLKKEYQRRIEELEKNSHKNESNQLNAEKLKIENNISRLIDSYAEGIINKSEFEPRIKSYKKRLSNIEQNLFQLMHNKNEQYELSYLIKTLEEFSEKIKNNLEILDWKIKRNIFEILIKQIEIDQDKITVVFRVSPNTTGNSSTPSLEDCRRRRNASISYFHSKIIPNNVKFIINGIKDYGNSFWNNFTPVKSRRCSNKTQGKNYSKKRSFCGT